EDSIRYFHVTVVQTCALPISLITQSAFFNFSQNKMIGNFCNFPIGVIPERKLLIFSNPFFKENELIQGHGIMDYSGLILIPPLRSVECRVGKELLYLFV